MQWQGPARCSERDTIWADMPSPRIRLAFEGLPAPYRRGVERAAADAGVLDEAGRVVTLIPLSGDDSRCARIDALAADGVVVALLDPFETRTIAHAIAHRVGCADLQAEPEQVVAAVLAALDGMVLMSSEALAGMIGHHPHAGVELSEEEAEWLGDLARGATVVQLADDFGYSERAMFRRLHELYTRLGVSNRTEALVTAQRLGLLTPG